MIITHLMSVSYPRKITSKHKNLNLWFLNFFPILFHFMVWCLYVWILYTTWLEYNLYVFFTQYCIDQLNTSFWPSCTPPNWPFICQFHLYFYLAVSLSILRIKFLLRGSRYNMKSINVEGSHKGELDWNSPKNLLLSVVNCTKNL